MHIQVPTQLRMHLRDTRIGRWYAQNHQKVYRLTNGRLGGSLWTSVGRRPLLLLTTGGRRTGAPRTTPLLYLRNDDGFIVVASNGGSPASPAWWLNLQADSRATVQIRRECFEVHASEMVGAGRERLWPELVDHYPAFTDYSEGTDRVMPIIVLERTPR